MKKNSALSTALLLATATLAAACNPGSDAPGFEPGPYNYGRMNTGPELGVPSTRPTLVIMMEFSNLRFNERHTPAFYQQLMHGPGFPNVKDYFAENSNGMLTLENAGVVGPFTTADDPATEADESRIECWAGNEACPGSSRTAERERMAAMRAAAQSGVDFSRFDENGDGTINERELLVVLVAAAGAPDAGGAVRGTDPWCAEKLSGVRVCMSLAGVAEYVGFATLAHETSHLMGTADLYGPWNNPYFSNAWLASLMGATITWGEDHRWTTHLDPWHKIQLGWAEPRVLERAQLPACVEIEAPHVKDAAGAELRRPVILPGGSTLADGGREYFILEMRQRTRGPENEPAFAGSSSYDTDTADTGLGVWYVRENPDGWLAGVPAYIHHKDNEQLYATAAPGSDDQSFDDGWDANPGMDVIHWGPDNKLQSTLVSDDKDYYAWEGAVLQYGPGALPDAGLPMFEGRLGESGTWKAIHPVAGLRLPGGIDTGMRFKVLPGATEARVRVAIAGQGVAIEDAIAKCSLPPSLDLPALAPRALPKSRDVTPPGKPGKMADGLAHPAGR